MNKAKHNRSLHAAQAALVIAGSFAAANARESRATFTVGATVLAVAHIDMQSVPADLVVTAADVRRGYVDVSEPTALVVSSNSPSGFALDLTTVMPLMSSVIVHGLESDQFLGADGGTLVQRWQGAHTATLSLRFRLVLADGLAEGRYPWPMRLRVRPLEAV